MKPGRNPARIAFLLIGLLPAVRSASGIEFGVLGGAVFARFRSPELSWSFRTSASVGIYARFSLARWLQLQPELRYTALSSETDVKIGNADIWHVGVNYRKTIQSLELPLVLRASLTSRGAIRPNLQLGVYGAWNLHGVDRLAYEGQVSSEDMGGELRTFAAGIVAGAGVDFRLGRIPIQLSALGRIGLTPSAKTYLGQDIKSSLLEIALGIGWPN